MNNIFKEALSVESKSNSLEDNMSMLMSLESEVLSSEILEGVSTDLESLESAKKNLEWLQTKEGYSIEDVRSLTASVINVTELVSLENSHALTPELYLESSLESIKKIMDKVKNFFGAAAAEIKIHEEWVRSSIKTIAATSKQLKNKLKTANADSYKDVPVFFARNLSIDGKFELKDVAKEIEGIYQVADKVNKAVKETSNDLLAIYSSQVLKAAKSMTEKNTISDLYTLADIDLDIEKLVKRNDKVKADIEKLLDKRIFPGNRTIVSTLNFVRQTNAHVSNRFFASTINITLSKVKAKEAPRTIHIDLDQSDIKLILDTMDILAKNLVETDKEVRQAGDIFNNNVVKYLKDLNGTKISEDVKAYSTKQMMNFMSYAFTDYRFGVHQLDRYLFTLYTSLAKILEEVIKR